MHVSGGLVNILFIPTEGEREREDAGKNRATVAFGAKNLLHIAVSAVIETDNRHNTCKLWQ